MIPRYSRPQMAAIWAPENRFRIWFEIEAHACDAMAELGIVPKASAQAIRDGGKKAMAALEADPAGNVAKIDAIEQVTRHDVIAFLTWLGEFIGPESRFVHQGMTSSDVLDTSFAVKLAGHYAAFARNRARLVTARAEIATCAISGPVGTFANVDPKVEAYVA